MIILYIKQILAFSFIDTKPIVLRFMWQAAECPLLSVDTK